MTEHEFIPMNFQGIGVMACRHCAAKQDSPQAKEDCKVRQYDEKAAPMTAQQRPLDPQWAILLALDSATIKARIDDLRGEEASLQVLYEAALAREAKGKKK